MKRLTFEPAAPLAVALIALLLAGCGGAGVDSATTAAAPAPLPEPSPVLNAPGDAFTLALLALVRSGAETQEPGDVDGVAPALPDAGEPVAVE